MERRRSVTEQTRFEFLLLQAQFKSMVSTVDRWRIGVDVWCDPT